MGRLNWAPACAGATSNAACAGVTPHVAPAEAGAKSDRATCAPAFAGAATATQ
jgi:hypothetical protein